MRACVLTAMAACVVASSMARAQCVGGWLEGFPAPSMTATSGTPSVDALHVFDPDGSGPLQEHLAVGGNFNSLDGFACARVAVWDGRSWASPPGQAPQGVRAIASFQGSLFAGANTGLYRNIGGEWTLVPNSPLGIRNLRVHAGVLYVAGNWGTSGAWGSANITRWDGVQWSAMGTGVVGLGGSLSSANVILPVADGVLVGGRFGTAGGVTTEGCAKWNGSQWTAMTGLTPGFDVSSLVEHQGTLYASGTPIGAGNCVFRWDGSRWVALPSVASSNSVPTLVSHGDALLAMGGFFRIGGVDTQVGRWNGTTWVNESGLPGFTSRSIMTPALTFRGDLVIGGGGRYEGAVPSSLLRWSPEYRLGVFAMGFDGPVRDIAEFQGEPVVVGNFRSAGGKRNSGVARFDGEAFVPMGYINNFSSDSYPIAATKFEGDLYISGLLNGASFGRVMRWDDGTWTSISTSAGENDMTVHDGQLVVAGRQPPGGVLRLVEGAFVPVGPVQYANHIASVGPFLYAGGSGQMQRWDGAQWNVIFDPETFNSTHFVQDIANVDGRAHVLVRNVVAPGLPANHLAYVVEGATIVPLGTGLRSGIGFGFISTGEMIAYHGAVVATGFFDVDSSAGPRGTSIARLEQGVWRALGGGITGIPVGQQTQSPYGTSLATIDDTLWIGGSFANAGGVSSPYVARWKSSPGPLFTSQPLDATVCDGESVTYEVEVDSTDVAIQWMWNGVPLMDGMGVGGATPTGSTSRVLVLTNVTLETSGEVRCIITNNCGITTSNIAHLTVLEDGSRVCVGCSPCAADYDQDGGVTGTDLAAFFTDFEAGAACADVDQDGGVTGGDIGAFFAAYEAGGC